MGDIDLLICSNEQPSVGKALDRLDYELADSTRRHAVYEPRIKVSPRSFAEHVDHPLRIEIHSSVAEPLPLTEVDITSELWPQQSSPGTTGYPSLSALMLHLLMHCAGNMRAHAMRQIQIHDIAALARKFGDEDWAALLAEPGTRAVRWWLFPPLALTERYYPGSIPREVLHQTRAVCPMLLRRAACRATLTFVSWSNLRIHALPGIAWSRSPREAARYLRSRFLPSREARRELEFELRRKTQLQQVPWYGISQRSRILRWLISRPPRVQTMASLRAALESASALND